MLRGCWSGRQDLCRRASRYKRARLYSPAITRLAPYLERILFGNTTRANRPRATILLLLQEMETIPGLHLVDRTEPASIRAKMVMTWPYGPDTYPDGPVTTVNFNTYVQDVLPNEWIPSWPSEALKAGAVAAKMFWLETDRTAEQMVIRCLQ